jgi:hypothetical protein
VPPKFRAAAGPGGTVTRDFDRAQIAVLTEPLAGVLA